MSETSPRTLVLVLGSRAKPYPALAETIEQTWAASAVEGVEVLFYYGGSELCDDGRNLLLPVADDLDHVGQKTLLCFAHVLEHRKFDLVFRTNLSSYVDLPNLRAYAASTAEPRAYYAGKGGVHDGVAFASGSGFFLSRDLVELAVHGVREWDHSQLDDVALAKVLAARGVEPVSAPRADVRSPREVRTADLTMFHFRCKTATRGRRADIEIMRRLHARFRELRGLDVPRRGIVDRWLARV